MNGYFDLKMALAPVWQGDIIRNESLLFTPDPVTGETPPCRLLCAPETILRVCSADLRTEYLPDVDYRVENGCIVRLPEGRLPFFSYDEYFLPQPAEISIASVSCPGRFVRYEDIADVPAPMQDDMDTVLTNIREKLIAGVEKRLDADAPVGFLLSGGLDSSLVCSIAAKKLGKPIRTFAIGMDTDAIDLKYARQTADYLGSEHHEIIINRDIVLQNLEEVIRLLGTWDITTIRASMGMYLLCKAIHEQTDVRVLLTGEISDELFGYKYTDYAPTADAFQQESQKRIRELYMYDVLRADRCISANSIEARVPFGDLDFVRYVMAIDPEMKLNRYNKGKYLLRKAFEGDWLPPEILWREKAAFSDAVGHSMVDDIKEYAESLYTDEEFQLRRANYSAHCMPFTKESLFYREIFEKYYHDQSRTIVGFWMPNKAWPGCNVNDPSARVLANYGASGV